MIEVRRFFSRNEIECNCGCGFILVDSVFLNRLTAARIISNVPYKVTSWCRCPKHNLAVGGQEDSFHLTGQGVDLGNQSSYDRFMILKGLMAVGFNRIGIYKDAIHVDQGTTKGQNMLWTK